MTISYIASVTITGLFILLAIIVIITLILQKITQKPNSQHVIIHPLDSTDESIEDAMKYIKLTNSITEYLHTNEVSKWEK